MRLFIGKGQLLAEGKAVYQRKEDTKGNLSTGDEHGKDNRGPEKVNC